ncbi:hypothetical protein CPB86DRAFT_733261 [Serendipita vermifera]|nr:hypothetical protein CPB86DRAFT_733261 [Serendipita vermifera]
METKTRNRARRWNPRFLTERCWSPVKINVFRGDTTGWCGKLGPPLRLRIMSNPQPETYTLFCTLEGEQSPFPIKIANNETVGVFKEAIKDKNPNTLANIDARSLVLYRIDIIYDENFVDNLNRKMAENPTELHNPTKDLYEIFSETPNKNMVHILVKAPEILPASSGVRRSRSEEEERDKLGSLPKKPKYKADITGQLLERWSHPVTASNLQTLHIHLQQPLTEEEKVPISQDQFDKLCVRYSSSSSRLQAEQLSTLFRVSEDEEAPDVQWRFECTIRMAPPTDDTEDAFHGFWDINISNILHFILSDVRPIRNSNRNTSIALKRPDYGLLVNDYCVFRGEEKGSDSKADPERELVDKLRWEYDPLSYILGYHAKTTKVRYVAITSSPLTSEPLFDHNLNSIKERVANLVHLIRLSGVIVWMGQQLRSRTRPEFLTFERHVPSLIYLWYSIPQQGWHTDAVERVSKLVEIYDLLKSKDVPNVDKLKSSDIEHDHPHVYLSPVGIDTLPNSGSEAFCAVVCVLEALKVMHSGPNPVYHRDIRDPNIVKKFNDQEWFLIDWSDASTAPTRAVTHLKESEHSPRVRQDNHGAEVDIWGIGRYMEMLASRVTCKIAQPDAVQQMAQRWISDLNMSAATALDEIKAILHHLIIMIMY